MKTYLSWFAILAIGSLQVQAQTGPAGVGSSSNCTLWLAADKGTSTTTNGTGVSSWNDQSGNGNHAAQSSSSLRPLYQSSTMNGMPTLLFDNSNDANMDELLVPNSSSLDQGAELSFFSVVRPLGLGGAVNAIFSKRNALNSQASYSWFFYTGNKLYLDIDGNGDRFNTNTAFSTGTNYLLSASYNGALSSTVRAKVYVGGSLDITSTETSSSLGNYSSDLHIGALNSSDNRAFNGHIAEVIIFKKALNSAERTIVDNYLSAKYNIPITGNRYLGDSSAFGNYDYNVAGIGTESSGSSSSFSASVTRGLAMSQNSGFDNGDYVFAGTVSGTNSDNTSDVGGMTGTSNARWDRIWYIDVTDNSTALSVNITFDASQADLGGTMSVIPNYVLLYRSGQSGSWTELATASGISGSTVSFTGVSLSSDGYYTLGTKNNSMSPLPVELVYYTAENKGREVELNWGTSSELENDHFVLEHSTDAFNYSELARIKGHGTHQGLLNYQYTDRPLLNGFHYYRLKQADKNGEVQILGVKAVKMEDESPGEARLTLIPNPLLSGQALLIEQKGLEGPLSIKVSDLYGNTVLSYETENTEQITLPFMKLPPGLYVLNIVEVLYGQKLVSRLSVQ